MLLEAASATGGRARSRVVDGYSLNIGPHALYRGGAAWPLLRSLGVELRYGRPRLAATKVRVDGEVRRLADLVAMRVRQRGRLLRLLAGHVPPPASGASAAEWIADLLADPVARRIAAVVVRTATYSADLDALAAGAAHGQLAAAGRGVCYLAGGWQSLVDALAARLGETGGEVRCGVPVAAVDHDEGGVGVVRLVDGTELPANRVIVALGDPRQTLRILGGPAAARLAPAVAAMTPVRMAHLDVALRPDQPRLANVFSLDDPVFISVPSDVAAVAPHHGMVIQAGRYLRADDERADHRGELEAALDAARPGWRDDVVDVRYVPSSMVAGDQARTATDGARRRVAAGEAGVPGLALAGDWVGPVGLLADASIASGVAAAAAVLAAPVRARA